jgi:hypothetical protein
MVYSQALIRLSPAEVDDSDQSGYLEHSGAADGFGNAGDSGSGQGLEDVRECCVSRV